MRRLPLLLSVLCCLAGMQASAQKTILWEISKRGNPRVSYLLGTLHQMGNSFIDERPAIRTRLLQAELALFETVEDRNEKIVAVMNARADDFAYRSALEPADVAFLERYTAGWSVPLSRQKPAELLAKMQHMYLLANCETVKPADSFNHMDDYLLATARRNGVRVQGLETSADQFQAINSYQGGELTWPQARDRIHYWVESTERHSNQKSICASVRAYRRMRLDYQFGVSCAAADPMTEVRNQRWMPQIVAQVDARKVFIAVGLFHLYGACGLITQLRNRGYEVNPVSLAGE